MSMYMNSVGEEMDNIRSGAWVWCACCHRPGPWCPHAGTHQPLPSCSLCDLCRGEASKTPDNNYCAHGHLKSF